MFLINKQCLVLQTKDFKFDLANIEQYKVPLNENNFKPHAIEYSLKIVDDFEAEPWSTLEFYLKKYQIKNDDSEIQKNNFISQTKNIN